MTERAGELDPDEWLVAMASPSSRLETVIWGYQTVRPTWRMTDRTLAEHLVYFPVAAGCVWDDAGTRAVVEPGDCLLLAPGVRHSFWPMPGRDPPTLYHFRFRIQTDAGEARLARPRVLQRGVWPLQPHLQQIVHEMAVPNRHAALRRRALWVLVLSSLLGGETAPASRGAGLGPQQRYAIWRYAQNNLAAWPRPADLARQVNLSPDHFSRVFRQTFGMPPRRWLLEQRIQHAAALLAESERPVGDVAAELGYEDVFLLSRQFKAVMGTAPSAYRKRLAQAQASGSGTDARA